MCMFECNYKRNQKKNSSIFHRVGGTFIFYNKFRRAVKNKEFIVDLAFAENTVTALIPI